MCNIYSSIFTFIIENIEVEEDGDKEVEVIEVL